MKEDSYYFEANRNAFTHEMLDEVMTGSTDGTTLRQYLKFGIDEEYLDLTEEEIDTLTTEELSHAVDLIDYLETK